MANTIKLRRSATTGAVPTTTQLALGEVAINTYDGKVFIKKDDGTESIVEVGASSSGGSATIGTIVAWPNSTVPTGWLECDGSAIPSQYTALIALIGSYTPDLRGEFIRGWDNGAGIDSGRTLGSSQSSDNLSHTHTVTDLGHSHSITTYQYAASSSSYVGRASGGSAGTAYTNSATTGISINSDGGTESRPRNVALMYIINADGSAIGSGGGTKAPPEITWTLTANGSSDYIFSGDGFPTSQNDPTLYLMRGQTYKFVNNTGAHPFRIQSTGATSGGGTQYNSGVTNQDAGNGDTLTFVVPMDAPDTLYYQCTSHVAMFGTIYVLSNTGSYADSNVDTHLNVSGASSGQILSWNGSDYAWVADQTGSGGGSYADSDVDSHLNVSAASSGQILSWNGSDYAWVADQTGSGGGGGGSVTVGSTAPSSPSSGDLWYDTANAIFYLYVDDGNSQQWIETGRAGSGGGSFNNAVTNTYTGAQIGSIVTLTDAATIAMDASLSNNFQVTLSGNRTFGNPTNMTAGQVGSIFINQDGIGSRTLSWSSYWLFPSGNAPTLSTAGNSSDRVDYIIQSSTQIHAQFAGDFQ